MAKGRVRSSRLFVFLFADVCHFSDLPTDQKYLTFCREQLADIAAYFTKAGVKNTFGDAVMAAFSDGSDAAVQALAVRDYFRNKYSGDPDLDGLGVRIGMHLGDAFVTMDPVTSRQTVAGRQVNLAARVEPVAPKNHVLVTDEFAGVVKHHTSRFKLSSAGFFDLPKNGGRRELFYLLRPYEAAPAVVGTAPPP